MASALPLVLLCLAVSAAAACPPDWSQCGSRCFVVQTAKLTMADAELNCNALGGNLASIHSSTEQDCIREKIKSACGSDEPAWIGLSDATQEGTWTWTDGSKFVFTAWFRGEPNNLNGEDCTQTNFRGNQWNDLPCSARLASVCGRRC